MLDQVSGRFLRVVAGLAGVCAVIALVGLADQYSGGAADALMEKKTEGGVSMSADDVRRLEKIMLKQERMEGREQQLLEGIEKGETHAATVLEAKKVVHAAAAQKVAAAKQAAPMAKASSPVQLPARPTLQAASLSATGGSEDLGGAPKPAAAAAAPAEDANEMKIDALKAKLAKVEAAEAATKDAKAHVAAAKTTTAAHAAHDAHAKKAAPAVPVKPITGKDFIKLPDQVATHKDDAIAKEAGLKPMAWIGSGKSVDEMLRKLNCDPSSFVCSGTPAQKKQALAIIKQIQQSVESDATEVKAYGWKEEHALPPAPHM